MDGRFYFIFNEIRNQNRVLHQEVQVAGLCFKMITASMIVWVRNDGVLDQGSINIVRNKSYFGTFIGLHGISSCDSLGNAIHLSMILYSVYIFVR